MLYPECNPVPADIGSGLAVEKTVSELTAVSFPKPSAIHRQQLSMLPLFHKHQLIRLACLALAVVSCQLVAGDHRNHIYKEGEVVPLFANKVGPFHNPR